MCRIEVCRQEGLSDRFCFWTNQPLLVDQGLSGGFVLAMLIVFVFVFVCFCSSIFVFSCYAHGNLKEPTASGCYGAIGQRYGQLAVALLLKLLHWSPTRRLWDWTSSQPSPARFMDKSCDIHVIYIDDHWISLMYHDIIYHIIIYPSKIPSDAQVVKLSCDESTAQKTVLSTRLCGTCQLQLCCG